MKNQHNFFINIAKEFSKQSTCCRKQVGAILVKDGRIVSTGYNGVPKGLIHCCDLPKFKNINWSNINVDDDLAKEHHLFSSQNELHAEQNVIAFSAKNGVMTDNCILYVTLSPCIDCAKLIVASGIKEVYFLEKYDRDIRGLNFLENCGIKITQIQC